MPSISASGLSVTRWVTIGAYAVTLLWDTTCRQWFSLRRRELLASSLGEVLAALGTPLEHVLDQQPPASGAA